MYLHKEKAGASKQELASPSIRILRGIKGVSVHLSLMSSRPLTPQPSVACEEHTRINPVVPQVKSISSQQS